MKYLFILLIISQSYFASAQKLWEKTDSKYCVQTEFDLDGIAKKLNEQFPEQKCIYLRDSVRVVLGSFFKCIDGKVYSYFRTQDTCKLFFSEAKKELAKFAPSSIKNKKQWANEFGLCMESAPEKRINLIGIQSMNNICYCLATKLDDSIQSDKKKLTLECAKNIGLRE